jgi:hypothetical protein
VGKVTATTARILVEFDNAGQIEARLTPVALARAAPPAVSRMRRDKYAPVATEDDGDADSLPDGNLLLREFLDFFVSILGGGKKKKKKKEKKIASALHPQLSPRYQYRCPEIPLCFHVLKCMPFGWKATRWWRGGASVDNGCMLKSDGIDILFFFFFSAFLTYLWAQTREPRRPLRGV